MRKISQLILVLSLLLATTACEDLFKNPLKDKNTGDDITLLILDRNFINTKLLLKFVDAKTDEPFENEAVEIQLWGDNANRLITYSGAKPEVFSTDIGFLELGYDPNFVVSKDDPLTLTLMAVSESAISAPMYLSYSTEGTKDVIVKMSKLVPGKSSKTGTAGEPFDISFNEVVNSSDLSFVTDLSASPTGTAYQYINLYTTLGPGSLLCDSLKDEPLYDDYGIYYTSAATGASLVPPSLPVKEVQLAASDFVFSTILKSDIVKCESGLTMLIDRVDGDPGTGTFSYLISFSNGDTKSGQVSGTFPIEHLIEQIYYPEADPSVSVQIFGDAQYEVSGTVNLASPCGETAQFGVSPKEDLHTFKFINQYICPGNPIGFALSVNGQFRIAESTGVWSSFEFVEGICELELVNGADYEFRVAIDDEFLYYTLPTDSGQLETFLQDNQGDDYSIVELTFTESEGMTEVFTILEVSERICEELSSGGSGK